MHVKKFVSSTDSAPSNFDPDCRCGPHGIESPTGCIASPLEKLDAARCECKRPTSVDPPEAEVF